MLISGEKNRENIALLEDRKLGKGCFKPSEYILYLIFFRHLTMVGGIIRHSLSNFCPGFLINQVGMSATLKNVSVVSLNLFFKQLYLKNNAYIYNISPNKKILVF